MRTARLYLGDCREVLQTMPAASVHCVVTSPPYYGLRDYKLEPVLWPGGWLGCLGLEPSPEMFIEHLVEVFREVRRVLRPDGVVFLNLGDSYWSKPNGSIGESTLQGSLAPHAEHRLARALRKEWTSEESYKQGDLMGIPWAVAFALRADGWWLRSDTIWAKPNPMPESVAGTRWERCRVKVAAALQTFSGYGGGSGDRRMPDASGGVVNAPRAEWADCPGCPTCEPNGGLVLRRGSWRPTKAHEYVFMLAPSADYFTDGEAVREPCVMRPQRRKAKHAAYQPDNLMLAHQFNGTARDEPGVDGNPAGRNIRSVWEVTTQGFPAAHFATMAPGTVEPCIKAGTSAGGCCGACGTPLAPVVDRPKEPPGLRAASGEDGVKIGYKAGMANHLGAGQKLEDWRRDNPQRITGWRPTCACAAPAVPCTVLDPFGGAGTTALVALSLGRDAILIEANPDYLEMAANRIRGEAPLLNRVEVIRPAEVQP